MALIGKVIAMTGVANIMNDKGEKRALHPGDQIQTGDSIQTTAGVDVDVQLANGRVIHIGADQLVAFTPELAEVFAPTQADSAVNVATIDTVIQALEQGRDINEVLEETAAGGAGGSDGSHSAVYLERINQTLNSLGFPDDGGAGDFIDPALISAASVPFVQGITDDAEAEGTSLVHTVTLGNVLDTPQTFSFSITGVTATAGVDFTSAITFSNGVTYTPSAENPFVGTITIPGGVSNFTVTIPTVDDNIVEGNESYTITVGGQSATGTITDGDDSPTVISVEPGAVGVGDDAVPEGTPLVYTVTLSGATTATTTYSFLLNAGGTAEGDDIGAPIFSNGVTYDAGTGLITVPSGVTSFTVTVPTIENTIYEGNETVPLTVGGVTGTGTITDEADKPTVVSVVPGDGTVDPDPVTGNLIGSTVVEGDVTDPLKYTVTLSGSADIPVTYPFLLNSGGSAEAEDIDPSTLSFTNGVTYDAGTGLITVPAGVTQFVVTVQTVDDAFYETNETVPLTVDGVTGIGTIVDNDSPVEIVASGFGGEYFGYNDVVDATYRSHGDDTTVGNLNSIADITAIINGRNGSSVVGTNIPVGDNVADATFNATSIDYGRIFAGPNSDLGRNVSQATDGATLDSTGNLYDFLNADADSAEVDAGVGRTSDAIIRMTGFVLVASGNYDFRVTADDGFSLRVDNKTLLEYDGNQSPTVREFNNLELEGGLVPMELIYWEQGGDAVLKIEYKPTGSDTWLTVDSANVPMFSYEAGLALLGSMDPATQEVYLDGGVYKVRDINQVVGDGADNTLGGTANNDNMHGNDGNDTVSGLAGDDVLYGDAGNDTLLGGDGNDELIGGAGEDLMNGGAGDDIYNVDSATEIANIVESSGVDTIEIATDIGAVILRDDLENATITHGNGGVLTGNASENRLTGGTGNDVIDGAGGDDRIRGGAGDDTLTGGAGNDVFAWELADKGSVGLPDVDHITDFVYTGNGTGLQTAEALKTDSIDLRDLLQGESSTQVDIYGTPEIGNLLNYLNVSVDGSDTVINISSTGGFAGGVYNAAQVDQRIVLDNVNLFSETGAADQAALLKAVLANGTLIVD